MYSVNRTLVVGIIKNKNSEVKHAVEIITPGNPRVHCLCGAISLQTDFLNQQPGNYFIGDINTNNYTEEITCLSCKKMLEKNNTYLVYDRKNHNIMVGRRMAIDYYYVRNLIIFARAFKKRFLNQNCEHLRKERKYQTCDFDLDGYISNCNWWRCKKIYNFLVNRTEDFLSTVSSVDGKICKMWFTEGDDECEGCSNLSLNKSNWPCNSCNETNNWKYFANKEKPNSVTENEYSDTCEACFVEDDDMCKNCNADNDYPNFVSEEEYVKTAEEEIPNSVEEEELCESCFHKGETIPKNGLVELPLGIQSNIVFSHPDFPGQWDTLTTAIYKVRFEKLLKLLTSLSEFIPSGYDNNYSEVIEKTLHTIAANITDLPTERLAQFREILEEGSNEK